MDSPELWRWIWLIGIGLFAAGEMLTAGSFFLLPLAVGAFVAFLMAMMGLPVPLELIGFLGG